MKEYLIKRIYGGIVLALAAFGTTVLAVAISGTIKTWTTGEVLKSSDLNTTITSLKTAIEGITSSQWTTTSGTNVSYSGGNVGIGTANPSSLFSISGGQFNFSTSSAATMGTGNNGVLSYNQSTGILDLAATAGAQTKLVFSTSNGSSATERMRINESGMVGIGAAAVTHKLEVTGSAGLTTGTSWTNISDERLKNIKGGIPNVLLSLEKLNPIQYKYNETSEKIFKNADGKNRYGFTAQNVKSVFPEMVSEDNKGYLWYNPSGFEAILTSAIKELTLRLRSQELVTDLQQAEKAANEKKLLTLEQDNKRLREDMARLRGTLEDRLRAIENLQMPKK